MWPCRVFMPDDNLSVHHDDIIIFFMHQAMIGLFCALEKYVGPSTFSDDVLYFVVLLNCMLKFSLDFIYIPFIDCDVSAILCGYVQQI